MGVRVALLVTPLLALSVTPSRAAPGSCQVIAIGRGVGSCRYSATGPGTFEVKTASGFVITAFDGTKWRTVASQVAGHTNPTTAVAVTSGTLATTDGDLVDVAIAVATITLPNGIEVARWQDGTIKAGDAVEPTP